MILSKFGLSLSNLHAAFPAWTTEIDLDVLPTCLRLIHQTDGQLLTFWVTDLRSQNKSFHLHLLFVIWNQGVMHLSCQLDEINPSYPDLCPYFPVANRLQRAWFDLMGVRAENASDQRPWLRHNAWSAHNFPLRFENIPIKQFPQVNEFYHFTRVSGEGVHEIPVGPIHAGIIEPGHFRFSIVGEQILKLEERLGYAHKGIHQRFIGCDFQQGSRLAGRISGDSTVAYAWAYSMAVEHLHREQPPTRALWLRALLLERERIMNHLGDLGALGNDTGFSIGYSQFSRLKEDMLRLNEKIWGHRYLRDLIVPGGVSRDIFTSDIDLLREELILLLKEIAILHHIYDEHDGMQDRFLTTGTISTTLAKQLGLIGMSARASGIDIDWRSHIGYFPYQQPELQFKSCVESRGDVAARVNLRFRELDISLQLCNHILQYLPQGVVHQILSPTTEMPLGIGCVEGWRGPILFAIEADENHKIRFAHVHDPSWQNWPAVEHAVLGNIVPDFPLINKSFNLSYSGHDL